jgi:HNH endonuclease
MTESELARFWPNIYEGGECWLWITVHDQRGYGTFRLTGQRKKHFAHRLAYEHWIGPIPAGLEIDHLCRTPQCVNPWHLEAVSHQVNIQRAHWTPAVREARRQRAANPSEAALVKQQAARERLRAQRTHCPQGHEYTSENCYWYRRKTDGYLYRICRRCLHLRSAQQMRARIPVTGKRLSDVHRANLSEAWTRRKLAQIEFGSC